MANASLSLKIINTGAITDLMLNGCSNLISYIVKEMENYITGLYLQLDANTEEDEGQLIDLLNHEKLPLDKKKAIVEKVNTKIIDLKNIEDSEVADFLLETSKVISKWKNIILYYHWRGYT